MINNNKIYDIVELCAFPIEDIDEIRMNIETLFESKIISGQLFIPYDLLQVADLLREGPKLMIDGAR